VSEANLETARRFFDAYNTGRPAEFLELLDEDVELHTLREVEKGHEGARDWLKKGRGKIAPRLISDRLFDRDERVLVLSRLQLRSKASNEVLQEADVACVFDFGEDGRVAKWRMYSDPTEALKELGIGA
jgi:ketosteroid isomerase-like protein